MLSFPSVAFLTGSVGTGEWVVLFVVVLIVVGPKRLPEIARKIGRTMEMFRRAADEFKDQIMTMDQASSSSASSPAPSAPSESPDHSDSYSDAYPNMADYPGNESHVENWSPDSVSEQPASAGEGPAGEALAPPAEDAAARADAAQTAQPERPAEGGV